MALTESKEFKIGAKAPEFLLPDTVSGEIKSLNDIKGNVATVVMFICNHCPYVVHVNKGMVQLANDYKEKGVGFIAISSNDVVSYPQDSPEKMSEHAKVEGYSFPYLYDETQSVAQAYNAACTPDFYVFDGNLNSVYHGQLDDSRPGNGITVTGSSIRNVLDSLLNNEGYAGVQKPSIGCSIKWK